MIKLGAFSVLSAFLIGCAADIPVPDNAVQSGDNYYLPLGVDADGCTRYQRFNPGKMSVAAVLYQTEAGKFSMAKDVSTCL